MSEWLWTDATNVASVVGPLLNTDSAKSAWRDAQSRRFPTVGDLLVAALRIQPDWSLVTSCINSLTAAQFIPPESALTDTDRTLLLDAASLRPQERTRCWSFFAPRSASLGCSLYSLLPNTITPVCSNAQALHNALDSISSRPESHFFIDQFNDVSLISENEPLDSNDDSLSAALVYARAQLTPSQFSALLAWVVTQTGASVDEIGEGISISIQPSRGHISPTVLAEYVRLIVRALSPSKDLSRRQSYYL